MNLLAVAYVGVLLLMPIGDTALIAFYRNKAGHQKVLDRRSLIFLWLCALIGLIGGVGFKVLGVGRMKIPGPSLIVSGIIITMVGILLRWVAMVTLKQFFSPHVAIAQGQPLFTTGIYHYLRHPAYTGILLVFFGLGVALENWLSLLSAVGVAAVGVINRVRVEEAALIEHYGVLYRSYAQHTKRFVPFLV